MNNVMKQVQKLIVLLVAWISLPIFLLTTNPDTLPLPFLVAPFVLLFISLYVTGKLFMSVFFRDIDVARQKLMAIIFSILPTLLLLLASIKQLTIRDTAIIIGLLILLMFYLRRLDFLKNR